MGVGSCKRCSDIIFENNQIEINFEPIINNNYFIEMPAHFHLFYSITKKTDKIRLLGSKFINKNRTKCSMILNNEEVNLKEFYEIEENDNELLEVYLTIKNEMEDLSYIFYGCSSLKYFDFIPGKNISLVKNISYMFYNCSSLIKVSNISKLNMSDVTNMSFMFSGCSSLKYIKNISNWNLAKVKNISNLFSECSSLKELPNISNWNTENMEDISYLFYGCSSLEKLPDISNWKLNKVVNMKGIFSFASSLTYLPDISNWETNNVTNMSCMFHGCSNLFYLPDIQKWNTENVENFSYMFSNCCSLKYLPDIAKWNTSKAVNMSYMFNSCLNLINLPNISEWDISNVKFLSYMFYDCSSLKSLPDISKWNANNISDCSMMFYNCSSLISIPELDKNKYIFKKREIINEDEKIELIGEIKNEMLDFIPQIELKFNTCNQYGSEIILALKNELKRLFKNDNFSIIEIKKGSLYVLLCLQYLILKEIRNLDETYFQTSADFFCNINDEIEQLSNELKNHEFISLGTTKPDFINENVKDLNTNENKIKLEEKINRLSRNNEKNFYENVKNIQKEDLEQFYQKLSNDAKIQENINIKNFINRLDEYNTVFDDTIENALKNSVFEYKIINIVIIEKESNKFNNAKNNCSNRVDKMLFHGTNTSSAIGIVSSQFIFSNVVHQVGPGVYMTDSLDYLCYYAYDGNTRNDGSKYMNISKIPKIGHSVNFVVSQIFYDQTKFEYVYDTTKRDIQVEYNGIRCAHDGYDTSVLSEFELRDYNKFYAREYVISNLDQILPLYLVTIKRVEYLVIWRDYNFNDNNPNNYDENTFKEMQEFHKKIKSFITRELNSKIYYINNDEEALKLLDRKRYNKIIIITNGNNNGEKFIHESRRIIGAEPLAAVSAYNVSGHIQWVKNMNNVLILNGIELHEKFFNCIINEDINLFHELKNEIIDKYNNNIPNFSLKENEEDLFNFPNFKSEGDFEDLTFKFKL